MKKQIFVPVLVVLGLIVQSQPALAMKRLRPESGEPIRSAFDTARDLAVSISALARAYWGTAPDTEQLVNPFETLQEDPLHEVFSLMSAELRSTCWSVDT